MTNKKKGIIFLSVALVNLAVVFPQHLREILLIKEAKVNPDVVVSTVKFVGGGAIIAYTMSLLFIIYAILMFTRKEKKTLEPSFDEINEILNKKSR